MLNLNFEKLRLLDHQSRVEDYFPFFFDEILEIGDPLLDKLDLSLPRLLLEFHCHHYLANYHFLLLQVCEWSLRLSILD